MRLRSLHAVVVVVVTLLLGALVAPGAASAQAVEAPTPNEVAYLAATKSYRDRLGTYQERLLAHQQAATEGQLDSIAPGDLGDLTRELFAARQAFDEEKEPPVRLDLYHRTMKLGLERAYDATVLLLRAQRSESIADNAALVREAGLQSASSLRLLREAADELRMLLPLTAL
jgi:hypothetical protein